MRAKTMGLAWILVKDFKKAIKFYTEVVGLKVMEQNEEWGWAELEGHEGGARLGIAMDCPDHKTPVKPGHNAILSFTVDNIEQACKDMAKQGAELIGEIEEVPGHVKMQLVRDTEGNYFHMTEVIHAHQHQHQHSGCCGGH